MDTDFVYVVKNTVPKTLCDQIIKKFEEDKQFHEDGQIGLFGVKKEWKDSTELHIHEHIEWGDIHHKMCEYVYYALDEYINQIQNLLYKICEPDGEDDSDFALKMSLGSAFDYNGMTIQRILKNKRYRWHCDESISGFNNVFSFILYLNTLEPDEGGKTKFISGKEVRPVAGNILFFPARWTCIHSGELVQADAKYILVGCIYRMPDEPYKGK